MRWPVEAVICPDARLLREMLEKNRFQINLKTTQERVNGIKNAMRRESTWDAGLGTTQHLGMA